MQDNALCQALLDHVREQLPEEDDAILGLTALLVFHPDETDFFLSEVMLLLMRHRCPLPRPLAEEVGLWLTGKRSSVTDLASH